MLFCLGDSCWSSLGQNVILFNGLRDISGKREQIQKILATDKSREIVYSSSLYYFFQIFEIYNNRICDSRRGKIPLLGYYFSEKISSEWSPKWFKRLELTKNQSLSACKQLASPQPLKNKTKPASNWRVSWTVLTTWSRIIIFLNKRPRIPKRQILSSPHLWVIYSCINGASPEKLQLPDFLLGLQGTSHLKTPTLTLAVTFSWKNALLAVLTQ